MIPRFLYLATAAPLFLASALCANGADTPPASSETKPKPREQRPTHPYGPAAAEADVKKLIVAEGLEATLFASEPMVLNPADMDVDERGRVWITEGANYRKWATPPLRPEGDRIVILEDTDGDGKADKETTFYQGTDVNTALGI